MIMRIFLMTTFLALLTAIASAIGPSAARTQEHPVLSVITTDDGAQVETKFSMSDLEMFEPMRFVTSTIWTDGEITFEGVEMEKLLDHLSIHKGTLELIAINDYFIQIEVDELRDTQGLLAYRQNGAPMSKRDKGPLWLVFPYDSDVKYQSETFYSRSIWQLSKIKVLP